MKKSITATKVINILMLNKKASIFLAAFLFTLIFTSPLFAQEKATVQEPQAQETNKEELKKEEPLSSEETKPNQEEKQQELSKEQLKQIAELDELLNAEKITQEEYDKQKAEIIGEKPNEEAEMAMLKSAQVEPEAQTLGKYIAPTVSTTNGSLNYSYPIVVPPGRNGLTPDIALIYDSTNKSHSSLIGVGWAFNIPYIQRTNKTGVEDMYSTDTFTSSIDGELIDQGSGIYTPRIENGSFLKYEYSSDVWTVTDKQGTTYEFGITTHARQDNPADTTEIFSWMLETVTDTNGNTVDYTYYKDQGQIYPDNVSYAGGLFEIDFNRTTRNNSSISYIPGFEVISDQLINQIQVTTDSSVTAEYDILTTDFLVDEISITGYESSSSITLPSTELEYTNQSSNGDFQKDLNFLLPTDSSGNVLTFHSSTTYGTFFQDVNGDSLPDIVRWYQGYPNATAPDYRENMIYLNTGTDFVADPDFSLPTDSNDDVISLYTSTTYGVFFQDINGDNLPDIIRWERGTPNGSFTFLKGNNVYLNTGSGFIEDPNFLLPTDSNGDVLYFTTSSTNGTFFQDVNGDGLSDFVRWYYNQPNGYFSLDRGNNVYLNTGTGFQKDPNFLLPTDSSGNVLHFHKSTSYGTFFQDINGDNLPDFVRWYQGYPNATAPDYRENMVYLNTGTGFAEDPNFLLPTDSNDDVISLYTSTNYGTYFQDVNGDNLPDFVRWEYGQPNGSFTLYKGNNVYLNTGTGFTEDSNFLLPTDSNGDVLYFTTSTSYGTFFQDIDGDGLPDFLRWYYNKPNGFEDWRANHAWLNSGEGFGYLSNLTNNTLGSVGLEYTQARKQDSSNIISFPVNVVDSITTDDNNGNIDSTSYEYFDADYYFNTFDDKRFAGFGSIIQTNPDDSVKTTKYHQNNGETGNEPTDSYVKIGKAYEQTIEDDSSNLYSMTRTNYTETNLGGISDSIQTESQISLQYDGTGTHTDTAMGYSYDAYGNVTTETQYGEVSGNVDGTFADSGSDKRTIDYTYTNDTTNYIVGLPTNQTLKNNSATIEAETDFIYDSDGNLLTKSDWISASNYADTTYTHNSYGLPLTETDALSNTTTYTYDTENMYPASIENAENHTTSYIYDYSSGKPETITEPNGKITEYDYDGLDRLIEVAQTIGNGGTSVIRELVYNTTASPQYTKDTIHRSGSESQDNYTYTDGFGKTIQTKLEMDTNWVTTDTVYDDMGRVLKQSLPYETTSSANSSATMTSALLTTLIYDPLGRVLTTTNAKGTTETDYDGFTTTITDAESNEKNLTTDAFGNLVQVKEHNGASTYTTDYEYNTQNLLTKITDAESNVRNIDYDGLGRRTNLEDLHDSSDGTFGTWNFSYDDINLTSQTDPKGTTTSYTYDDINRVLTEDNNGTGGVEVTYTYDSCTNGTGQLCSVVTPDLTTTYTYFKQGLVDIESKLIDTVTYTTDTDYNYQGEATKVTHPNSSYTEYGYNTRGLVDELKYNGTSLVTADYGVHGRPTAINHANGVDSTLTYDATELYELTNKTTTDGVTDFQDLLYTYDDVGNITQIVDASDTTTAKTQTFTYDDLYRLTGTAVTGSANSADYTRSYTYSPIGNITAFDGTSYAYTDSGYSNPHAVTSVGATSYSYDNNGNLTSDGIWTHTWDYRNRLTSSTNGVDTSSYEYDSNNQRIKLVEGASTTIYPSSSYKVEGTDITIDLSLGDTLVATDFNGTIEHIHTDHLGGTNITTDTSGVLKQTTDYYPYGDMRIDTNTGANDVDHKYTGYEYDRVTGLTYQGARYYTADNGRFISQDPANLRLGTNEEFEFKKILTNPQLLNTYSYAGNDPINNIDDNGELSLRAALTNPFAIPASLGLSAIAQFGGNRYNIPVSQQLLQHSLNLEPRDLYAGQNSSVANVIQSSDLFNTELNNEVSKLESGGTLKGTFELNLDFREDGNTDAYSAIGAIDLDVQGSQNQDGTWNLSFSGNDPYDYGYNKSDWKDNFPFGAGANILSVAQKLEISSKYDTKVEFKKENYSTKKDKNNSKKRND